MLKKKETRPGLLCSAQYWGEEWTRKGSLRQSTHQHGILCFNPKASPTFLAFLPSFSHSSSSCLLGLWLWWRDASRAHLECRLLAKCQQIWLSWHLKFVDIKIKSQFSSVQLLSLAQLFVIPWTAAPGFPVHHQLPFCVFWEEVLLKYFFIQYLCDNWAHSYFCINPSYSCTFLYFSFFITN